MDDEFCLPVGGRLRVVDGSYRGMDDAVAGRNTRAESAGGLLMVLMVDGVRVNRATPA